MHLCSTHMNVLHAGQRRRYVRANATMHAAILLNQLMFIRIWHSVARQPHKCTHVHTYIHLLTQQPTVTTLTCACLTVCNNINMRMSYCMSQAIMYSGHAYMHFMAHIITYTRTCIQYTYVCTTALLICIGYLSGD